MSTITGTTRGGIEWTPAFVTDLNQGNCIGCGRCFKVCPKKCLRHEPAPMAA
jgi:formate hydrogenlyase subunit 6/NADH:ubiquinone oxidoreductase subunit I